MVRLGSVALIALAMPTALWAGPPTSVPNPGSAKHFHLPHLGGSYNYSGDERFGRAQIAPNAQIGIGMFGLKSERSQLRPVTGRELDAPKHRRAAVGFSLRF